MAFPDNFTNAIDGVTEIEAAHLNNLEKKVGVNHSSDPQSLDYILRHQDSVDPGHRHSSLSFTGGLDGHIFHRSNGVWEPKTPDTAGIVDKTTSQTIGGIKTFTSIPILPGTDPADQNHATRKGYVDGVMSSHAAQPNAHHSQVHSLVGADHTASGLIPGQVLRATGPNTYDFQALQETDLPNHKHSGLHRPDGSTQAVFVDASGNLGVGTSTPVNELEVRKQDGNCRLGIRVSGSGQYSNLNFGNDTVTTAGQIRYDHNTNRMEFTTNNVAQRLVIDSQGNVGIGTTNFGSSAVRSLSIRVGTAPTTSVADVTQLFAARINNETGKTGLHIMNEVPAGVRLIVPGIQIKATTGDPTEYFEGLMVINTADKTLKIYADGGFRTLASWS